MPRASSPSDSLPPSSTTDVEAALVTATPRPAYPTIADRAAWEAVRERLGPAESAELVARAETAARTPIPNLPASLFLEFQRRGERAGYERPQDARRESLTALVPAECLEKRGRFLDPILDDAWAICEESN